MQLNPKSYQAYHLLHDGILALARAEQQGIRVDMDQLQRNKRMLTRKSLRAEIDFQNTKFYKQWQEIYGDKMNLNSGTQLGHILYDVRGLEPPKLTDGGKGSTDKEALKILNIPELNLLTDRARYKKIMDYLDGFERETVDGFIHPNFNLNTVGTYRSSSSSVNFQNIPIRDKEAMEATRSILFPRKGHRLLETDFRGIEVAANACLCRDKNLIKYVSDPKSDMHGDMAKQIFFLDKLDKSIPSHKLLRQAAKNSFVFPEFYGDYYVDCAEGLADWMELPQTRWKSGQGIVLWDEKSFSENMLHSKYISDHMIANGIKEFGKVDKSGKQWKVTGFLNHIKEIEEDFWTNRFPEYSQWKDDFWNEYQTKGYFDLVTGFRCSGVMQRNQVINAPGQGCLQGKAKILTQDGWIPIENLVGVYKNIWTGFKWAKATALFKGNWQYAKINLSSGLSISCDTRHKIKNDKNEWINFENLKIGDYVALPRTENIFPATKKMNWPFIFGFIIGDGCLHSRRDVLTITVGIKKKPILLEIKNFLIQQGYKEGVYGGIHWYTIPAQGNKNEKYKLTIENKKFAAFLKSKGFFYAWKSHTKRIPNCIWTYSKQKQRDFMEGLWMSDGTRDKEGLRNLNMCNKELLQEVQILISALGFDSYLDKRGCLRVHWKESGAISPRKFPKNFILKYVPFVTKKNYTIKELNSYIKDNGLFNKAKRGCDFFQNVAERILEHNSIINEIYRFDTIKSIEISDVAGPTYTMSVDDDLHQFVADGVITKNSAFHCLLWSLIQLDKELLESGFDSKIIGQIHDSIVLDVHPDELEEVAAMAHRITTVDLPKAWDWIIVPLEIEMDLCEVDMPWSTKTKYEFAV